MENTRQKRTNNRKMGVFRKCMVFSREYNRISLPSRNRLLRNDEIGGIEDAKRISRRSSKELDIFDYIMSPIGLLLTPFLIILLYPFLIAYTLIGMIWQMKK